MIIHEQKTTSLRLKSLLGKAVMSSLVFHLTAYGLIAAWGITKLIEQPQFQGDAVATQIVLHLEQAEPSRPMVSVFSSREPVLITPGKAHHSSQTFLDTSSADVDLSELIDASVLKLALLDTTALDAEAMPAERQPFSEFIEQTIEKVVPQNQLGSSTATRATPPDFSGNRPPRYPPRDMQLGHEGLVLLRLHVDQQGRVTEVQLIQSSGYATLDAAAASAVRTWQGKPALRKGKPIATTWDLPVRFRLGN